MDLKWNDLVIEKFAIDAHGPKLIGDWLWLVPQNTHPMLGTACGDLFLEQDDGAVLFLDTVTGKFSLAATSYEDWKASLADRDKMEAWFRCEFLAELLTAGLKRKPNECFSPELPQACNGSWDPSNFKPAQFYLHLCIQGQIHQQIKDLPQGTKIKRFDVVEE